MDNKINYSKKTEELISRMCRNVERKSFRLNKKKAEECLLKTYDLFELKRPKKIVWLSDPFTKTFQDSARSAWSARNAGNARSAWSARNARSAGSYYVDWTALDDDFYYFIFSFEYCQNPDKEYLPNENDFKYLEYCELLLQAKEAGLGYQVEWEDTLYLVPTPLIKIDEKNRFHSLTLPAIRWKKGKEFYYINGINLKKELWEKITQDKTTKEDWMDEKNLEVRRIIQEQMKERFVTEIGGKVVGKHEDKRIGEVIEVDITPDPEKIAHYLHAQDWSTERMYFLRIPPTITDPEEAQKWTYSIEEDYPQDILRS